MRRFIRMRGTTLGLATFMFLVSGCSTYRTVPLSTTDAVPESGDQEERIAVGDNVRITLVDDIQISGRIQDVQPEGYTVRPRPPFGSSASPRPSPRLVAKDEILSIEVSRTSLKRSIVLGVVIAGAVVGLWAATADPFGGGVNWEDPE